MEPVTLSWTTVIPMDFPAWEGRNAMMDRYRELHPNVEFAPEVLPFDQWHAQELARALAGDAPAISENGQLTAELVVADVLVQTDSYIERDGLRKDDYWGWCSEIIEFDGRTWGHPGGATDTTHSVFNPAILAEAGAEPPVTWDDVLALADPVTAVGKYGYAFVSNPENLAAWHTFAPLLASNEGAILRVNPDGSATATLDSQEAIETVEFIQQLVAREAVPPTALADTWDVTDQKFINGELAHMLSGVWLLPRLDQETSEGTMTFTPTYGLGPKKKVDAGTTGGLAWYIYKTEANPDVAWDFISFLNTDEGISANWTHAYPAPKRGLELPPFVDNPDTEFVKTALAVSTAPVPPVGGWVNLLPLVWRAVVRAVSGQATAQDAMAAANLEVQSILDSGHNLLVRAAQ
jgi:ABC-type glycerol-3-phosphate transport system substrate-binding protein